MGRRKGRGWVNGPWSWESWAGLVVEGAESKPRVHLPPTNLSVFSVGVQGFPQGFLCLGPDGQDHACHPGSLSDGLRSSLWRPGFWDVIAAATQVGLSPSQSCARAHVLPVPVPLAVATAAAGGMGSTCAAAGTFPRRFDAPVHPCGFGMGVRKPLPAPQRPGQVPN